ncbi:hypothetical protein SAMN02745831_02574 [Streptomyces sp. PgraA7]|nr:hypothetical protein SAMN02745831_02574 [Streptomyces sp. PgraA7]
MPVTDPWLAGPSPEKRLDRERLAGRPSAGSPITSSGPVRWTNRSPFRWS